MLSEGGIKEGFVKEVAFSLGCRLARTWTGGNRKGRGLQAEDLQAKSIAKGGICTAWFRTESNPEASPPPPVSGRQLKPQARNA